MTRASASSRAPRAPSAGANVVSPFASLDRMVEFLTYRSDPARGRFQATLFALAHQGEGGQPQHLTEDEIRADADPTERAAEVQRIAEQFHAEAMCVASTTGRTQAFFIAGYRSAETNEEPVGSSRFLVQPPPGAMGDAEAGYGEPPTTAGALAFMTRQAESMARQFSTTTLQCMQILQDVNKTILERNTRLEQHTWEMYQQREQLADQAAERQMRTTRGYVELEREERLYKFLESFGARLVARALGADDPLLVQAGGFFKSITPEQGLALAQILTDEQKKALVDIAKAQSTAEGKVHVRIRPEPAQQAKEGP